MTCIVGLEYAGKVFLGGDIQGTGYNNKIVHTQPKVFHKKNVIFGFTSSYRFGQILEHDLPDPVVPEDVNEIYRWLITVLVPSMKSTLEDHDYKTGGQCLIGVRDQLWDLQTDYSVLRSVLGYSSCGSGSEYALGSLTTSLSKIQVNPGTAPYSQQEKAIREAIKVASIFSPSVGAESTIIST